MADDTEVDEANFQEFLTEERPPLPDDSYADEATATAEDLSDEEVLADRDDFDDDDVAGEELP